MINLKCVSSEWADKQDVKSIYNSIVTAIKGKYKTPQYCVLNGHRINLLEGDNLITFFMSKRFYEYKIDVGFLKSKGLYEKYITDSRRNRILTVIDVPVCPYCNENYTYSIDWSSSRKWGKHALADLDHFYPKYLKPEYSLCLYNFVPACAICNSRLKHTRAVSKKDFIYPHEEGFADDAVFHISNIPQAFLGERVQIELTIKTGPNQDKIKKNIELFQLEKRYNNHIDYVQDLYERSIIYQSHYLEELETIIDVPKEKIKKMVWGNELSEEQYGKVSLGKLKYDILHQLKIES